MKKIFACLAVALITNSPAFAADEPSSTTYIGGGYHSGTYEEDGIPDFDLGAIELKFGKYLGSQVAVEGRLLLPVDDDSNQIEIFDATLELKNAISLFLRGDIPLGERANFYGLLGFTNAKFEVEFSLGGDSISDSESESDLSYGLGVDGEIASGLAINAEYIFYLSEDDYDYSGFVIGLTKKF